MRLKKKLVIGVAAMSVTVLGAGFAAAPAAAVGPGTFLIPAGATAAFSGATFHACDVLTWGYELNPPTGPNQDQFKFSGPCDPAQTAPDVTIPPAATDRTLRVYLTDDSCGATYYSDGTSNVSPTADHVFNTVTGPNAYNLKFADSGGGCAQKFLPRPPIPPFNSFANFQVNLTITLPIGADLSISKTAPATVVSGDQFTYMIVVTDNGPSGATGVTVTDALPATVHFNSVSSTQGTCTRSTTTKPKTKGGIIMCSLGDLANGSSATIDIVVTATQPGPLSNTAMVSGNELDPNPTNNSSTALTTVTGG